MITGTSTKLDTLTENERRRHETILAQLAQLTALVNRTRLRELPGGEDDAAVVA